MSEDPARRGRILVVDDNEMASRVVMRTLAPEHDVVGVKSGHDALERLKSGELFDLVLCDLMMPEMTGMDLHDVLTSEGHAIAERMVFMTGGAVTERARTFIEGRPANRLLEKPFDSNKLRALAREFVRLKAS